MADAKTRAQCIRMLERDGRLTAQELVNAARDRKHPMHSDFTWNDREAGEQHRLNQARGFIAGVRVLVTTSTKRITAVGYVRDPEAAPAPGYVSVVRLRTERDVAEDALTAEMARLQSILERTRELAAALELEEEHQLAFDAVTALSSRMRRGRHGDNRPPLSS